MIENIRFRPVTEMDSDIIKRDKKENGGKAVMMIIFAVLIFIILIFSVIFGLKTKTFSSLVIFPAALCFFEAVFVILSIKELKAPKGICETKVLELRVKELRDSDADPKIVHYLYLQNVDNNETYEIPVDENIYVQASVGGTAYIFLIGKKCIRTVI